MHDLEVGWYTSFDSKTKVSVDKSPTILLTSKNMSDVSIMSMNLKAGIHQIIFEVTEGTGFSFDYIYILQNNTDNNTGNNE